MVATIAAAHSVKSTKSSGRWSESHQGGPPDVCAIAGTATEGPATAIAIIHRREMVMQAVAVQTSPRVFPGARVSPSLTVFAPQV
jgi:hypothetical protein